MAGYHRPRATRVRIPYAPPQHADLEQPESKLAEVMQTREELDEREADGPLAEPPPQVSPSEASALAAEMFGVEGRASRLDSERDANYRIEGRGGAYVLK